MPSNCSNCSGPACSKLRSQEGSESHAQTNTHVKHVNSIAGIKCVRNTQHCSWHQMSAHCGAPAQPLCQSQWVAMWSGIHECILRPLKHPFHLIDPSHKFQVPSLQLQLVSCICDTGLHSEQKCTSSADCTVDSISESAYLAAPSIQF